MKMNIFAVNNTEDIAKFPGRETGGNRVADVVDAETELITELDEQNMPLEKRIASRFLTFLGNKRLTLEKLKLLSVEEQQRLKREFLESY